jgi:hypothetical protein
MLAELDPAGHLLGRCQNVSAVARQALLVLRRRETARHGGVEAAAQFLDRNDVLVHRDFLLELLDALERRLGLGGLVLRGEAARVGDTLGSLDIERNDLGIDAQIDAVGTRRSR